MPKHRSYYFSSFLNIDDEARIQKVERIIGDKKHLLLKKTADQGLFHRSLSTIYDLNVMGRGGQKAIQQKRRDDFFRSYTEEPHVVRRKQILEKHPEIETLFGNDPRPVPIVIFLVLTQLVLSYYQQYWSWPVFLLVSWSYGGTASQALLLMSHEVSHNLVFKTPFYNELFGIFCNVGNGFPSSTMFKRYHMEHHQFQGDTEKDTDLPTVLEGKLFTNSFLKLIWMILQPLFYAIRPTIVRPKSFRPMDIFNIVAIFLSNALVVYFCGPRAVVFLLGSSLLGMGLHPVAGHFIAEHYVFTEGYETYSYYGPLNLVTWNVGYHNEHHDFPRVPGWKLPLIKAMAPEFYDNLPQHKSWTGCIIQYILDPKLSPFSRVRRDRKDPLFERTSASTDKKAE